MTAKQKTDILKRISDILDSLVEETNPADDICERRMLTIKECTQVIDGVSEHTVRILVKRGDIPSIRAGIGKNGKILIPEKELVRYFCETKRG